MIDIFLQSKHADLTLGNLDFTKMDTCCLKLGYVPMK